MYRYYLLHKPFGVLSQFTTPVEGKKGLGSLFNFPKDVYPVGRLDEDSEGLLLLTNDPRLNAQLLGEGAEKTYWAQVEGSPSEADLEPLRRGITLRINQKDHRTLPAQVELLEPQPVVPERNPPIRFRASIPTTWIALTIREGKNRQVRRMTAAVGFPTLRLIRVKFAAYELGQMQPGEVVEFDL
ncbi:MAG: pseudouridine synthase [Sphingobacteriaceae bacterium]|nr:pseudouridine synthase [Sphingobacteriaceae bacterium]